MFLDLNFKRLSKISGYPPPFGVRTQGMSFFLSLFYSQEKGEKIIVCFLVFLAL